MIRSTKSSTTMIYPSKSSLGDLRVDPNVSNHNGSSKLPDQLIRKLTPYHQVIDHEAFYQAAQSLLSEIKSPTELAICAELIGQREPGGTYYRAVFWGRVKELLNHAEAGKKNDFDLLRKACEEIGMQYAQAKEFTVLGETITRAERIIKRPLSLRELPPELFTLAQRQKAKAKDYLIEARRFLDANPNTKLSQVHLNWCRINGSLAANFDIIKPSDWWAFSHPKWPKEEDFPGSIPGEVYANAIYYFAPERGIAVDPMAGSGMIRRVYQDRNKWQKDRKFNLKLYLFDLFPKRRFIKEHNASNPLPFKADWIFLDPPYFGQSEHLYEGDLAQTKDYPAYLKVIGKVVQAMRKSLNRSGRLCVLLPKWSGAKPEDTNHDLPSDVKDIAVRSGLKWIDAAYISRARQQEPGSALKNNLAKRELRMRSDVCVLNIFEK